MFVKNIILLPVIIFLSYSIIYAQSADIKFEHLTVEEGLSNNKIRCFLQDKYGFIWIGTNDGLSRYDGYEFTVYRNDPADSTSLSSNWITALYEDWAGDIWISTMNARLNKFDRDKEIFINTNNDTYRELWGRGTSFHTVKQIAEYHYKNEKVLWIGTATGLHKFDPETGIFTPYPHTTKVAPYTHIQTVVVDKAGMVWIGSLGDGLHKFNPYTEQFTHYRHDPDDKNSLSHNTIHYLFIDHKGILWIATNGGGLNRYDPEKKRFICYKHDPNDLHSISSNLVQSIYEDHLGVLWIGTNGRGLNIFNRETETFRHFLHDPNDPASLANNTVWHIFEDKTGVMWIGTWSGVDRIIPRKNQFYDYKKIPENPNSLADDYVSAIHISNHEGREMLWIGTRKGLVKIDRITGQYTHFVHDPSDKSSIPGNRITSLFEDRSGILWIGTYEHGLIKFNQKTGYFKSYTHDPQNPNSISSNIIESIYEDKQGTFWIGIYDGGLDMFDCQKEIFKRVSTELVTHMIEDRFSVLWAASNSGLKKYDKQIVSADDYSAVPCEGGPVWIVMKMVMSGDDGNERTYMWINPDPSVEPDTMDADVKRNTTANSGFNNLALECSGRDVMETHWDEIRLGTSYADVSSPHTSMAKESFNYPAGASIDTLLGGATRQFAGPWYLQYGTDSLGYISDTGLDYDGTVYKIPHTGNHLQVNNPGRWHNARWFRPLASTWPDEAGAEYWLSFLFQAVRAPSGNTLYIVRLFNDESEIVSVGKGGGGTNYTCGSGWPAGGLPVGPFFAYLRNNTGANYAANWPELNRTNFILEPHNSNENCLWTATYSGLNRFDRQSEEFVNYNVKDGLPGNVINSMLEDEQGNLWLGTNNGLSRFNPRNKTFKNFDVSEGLLSIQFSPGACAQSRQGEMFFCTSKGVNSFFPDKIATNKHIPDIVVTDFQLFHKSVGIRKDDENRDKSTFLLDKHVSLINEIILSYHQNVLSFKFSALDYNIPKKNLYAYKMDGVDPDWIYTDAIHRIANYTQLSPGEYTFRVRGSNNDGIWNEEGTSIKIIINPPWWRTNLAYAFYILLFVSIVFATWRAQLKRIYIKQQLKMEHFEAEKLREVDQLKSQFFANISHEFRTPLTLIKGPVKQIMESEIAENLKEKCKVVLRNSDRLLGLINQILDLSKLESGEMKLQVAEIDIVKYLEGLVLSFSSLAERKKITLKLDTENKNISGYVDRDKFEKIITNLLSNAFKFTSERGQVEVTVTSPIKLGEDGPALAGSGGVINESLSYPSPHPIPYPKGKGRYELVGISIFNTGPGLPPDQLDKIFDRFYQTDSIYKKDDEGSGIGLALTKELVEVCRGEISVSSIPGESTTFTVKLPIAKESFKDDEIVEKKEIGYRKSDIGIQVPEESTNEDVLQSNQSPVSGLPANRRGLQSPLLLIVEDNPDVTNYISSFMGNDYRILTAENGKEGLKKTLDKYPDLVISDVMMPEMDGFEFCQKVKSDERISHIPVILLTAKADLDSKIDGLEFGADDYITKPFEARELQIRAGNLIEQRRKLREKFSKLVELDPAEISASSMDEQLLQRLLAVFEEHIEEPEFTTEKLAREIGISRMHLNRKINALTNLSTNEFLRTLRLQRAAQLLRNASGTVSEIAYKVGFNNLSYFSKTFRKQFGKLPSEFTE